MFSHLFVLYLRLESNITVEVVWMKDVLHSEKTNIELIVILYWRNMCFVKKDVLSFLNNNESYLFWKPEH